MARLAVLAVVLLPLAAPLPGADGTPPPEPARRAEILALLESLREGDRPSAKARAALRRRMTASPAATLRVLASRPYDERLLLSFTYFTETLSEHRELFVPWLAKGLEGPGPHRAAVQAIGNCGLARACRDLVPRLLELWTADQAMPAPQPWWIDGALCEIAVFHPRAVGEPLLEALATADRARTARGLQMLRQMAPHLGPVAPRLLAFGEAQPQARPALGVILARAGNRSATAREWLAQALASAPRGAPEEKRELRLLTLRLEPENPQTVAALLETLEGRDDHLALWRRVVDGTLPRTPRIRQALLAWAEERLADGPLVSRYCAAHILLELQPRREEACRALVEMLPGSPRQAEEWDALLLEALLLTARQGPAGAAAAEKLAALARLGDGADPLPLTARAALHAVAPEAYPIEAALRNQLRQCLQQGHREEKTAALRIAAAMPALCKPLRPEVLAALSDPHPPAAEAAAAALRAIGRRSPRLLAAVGERLETEGRAPQYLALQRLQAHLETAPPATDQELGLAE